MVGQLLDIAELEAFAIDPAEVADLQAVCAEVAGFVAPLALEQGREIALLGVTAPVWVKGNAEMMKRAIRNLAETRSATRQRIRWWNSSSKKMAPPSCRTAAPVFRRKNAN